MEEPNRNAVVVFFILHRRPSPITPFCAGNIPFSHQQTNPKQMIAFKSGSLLIPPTPQAQEIIDGLALPNPKHEQVVKMRARGKRIMRTPPEHVYASRTIEGGDHDNWLAVPRAVNGELSRIPCQLKIIDRTTFPPRGRELNVTGMESRDYQNEAVDAFMAEKNGVIEAPCGAGKTAIGIQVIARLQTRALVLVHTRDLLKQWMDRLKANLDPEPVIGRLKLIEDSPDVIVETVQTLVKYPWHERAKWGEQFGLVIMDEAHHTPADTFSDVISSMSARYRLALTATPERSDGLTQLLHWHFGGTIYKVDRKQLEDAGQIVTPTVCMVSTQYQADPGDWVKMLSDMTEDGARNGIIFNQVRDLVKAGHRVLVITERVDHAIGLAEMLSDDTLRAKALTGEMPKKAREALIGEATAGNVDVLCATTIADEGLDMPCLSAIVLAMPVSRAIAKVEQRVGRIMRPYPGKPSPIVIDLVDDTDTLRGLAWKRIRKVYRKLGCAVEGM